MWNWRERGEQSSRSFLVAAESKRSSSRMLNEPSLDPAYWGADGFCATAATWAPGTSQP